MALRFLCFQLLGTLSLASAWSTQDLINRTPATPPVGSTVQTSSGPVSGHAAPHATQVSEYLGIPYAQPPVGDLRWAEPRPFRGSAPINASNYPFDCPAVPARQFQYPMGTPQQVQIVANFAEQNGTPQNEDCLGLNVWVKNPDSRNPKAVLLWIHGGRFVIGSTNNPFYNGEFLADREDLVIVSTNYRLGVFGFPGAPAPTNLGLLDQRLAVEWVRDNIAKFGGDPSRITIFGQSAGGVSVDYYQYAWTKDPIVAGSISHSGTAFSYMPNNQSYASAAFYNVSIAIGCAGSGDVLPCMRTKNVTSLLAAVAQVPTTPSLVLPQPVFQPVIDEMLVFSNYTARAAAGKFIKKPYFVGSNDNEAGYYKISAAALNLTYSNWVWNLFNLEAFTCATTQETRNVASAPSAPPVFRYRYFGDFENLRLYPGSGAYHGADVNQVFGTSELVSGIPPTPQERDVSGFMMKTWAAFAKDPEGGLRRLGWPEYDPDRRTLGRLAYKNKPGVSFVEPSEYDCACSALEGDLSYARGGF